MIRSTALLILGLILSAPLLAGPPQPFTMTFDAYWGDTDIGNIRMQLTEAADGQYRLISHSEAEGLAALYKRGVQEEESRFSWQETGRLRETRYESRNIRNKLFGGKKTSVEIRSEFSWPSGAVTYSAEDKTVTLQAPDGATDRQLLPFALGAWVAEHPPEAGQAPIDIHFIDDHKVRHYGFTYAGEETLDTAVGKLRTQKFERDSGSRTTTIWLAVDHGHLPVRFDKQKRGDTGLSTRLKSLER